jgi:hypothetical protein
MAAARLLKHPDRRSGFSLRRKVVKIMGTGVFKIAETILRRRKSKQDSMLM